jgi:HAE1 family hydrophobic/amphiphilic exporter-1
MSLPLRNRTALAQVAVGLAEGKRLAAQQEAVSMAVEADVRNSLQSLFAARSRLDSAESASKFAEEQYASEQRQFQAGTSSVFLVLQRQTDLIAARSREIRAKADVGSAIADLDRATARTLIAQNIDITPNRK